MHLLKQRCIRESQLQQVGIHDQINLKMYLLYDYVIQKIAEGNNYLSVEWYS